VIVVPFEVTQDEHLSRLFAKTRDRLLNNSVYLAIGMLRIGSQLLASGQVEHQIDRHRFCPFPLTNDIERGIDARSMKITRRIRFQVDRTIAPGKPQEDGLNDIFRINDAARNSVCRSKNPVRVIPEKGLKLS